MDVCDARDVCHGTFELLHLFGASSVISVMSDISASSVISVISVVSATGVISLGALELRYRPLPISLVLPDQLFFRTEHQDLQHDVNTISGIRVVRNLV